MTLPCCHVLSVEGSLVTCGRPVLMYGPGRPLCDRHAIDESFVYVVQRGDYVKIGLTVRPTVRLKQIMSGLGCIAPPDLGNQPTLLALVRGDLRTERLFHAAFSDHRAEGEWFRIEGRLAKWIAPMAPTAPDLLEVVVAAAEEPDLDKLPQLSPVDF